MKIKDPDFFKFIKEYLTVYLPLQRCMSEKTIKSYRETLNQMLSFTSGYKGIKIHQLSMDDVTADNVNEYLRWLESERKCSSATVNHHLAVIRAFMKYVGICDPVLNAHFIKLQQVPFRKRTKNQKVEHFSEAALEALLAAPAPMKKKEHRDLFYMILLYDTGARNSEILGLHGKDCIINTNAPYVVIRGKGDKIRTVPIMQKTVDHLKSYAKRFDVDLSDEKSTLFYTVIHGNRGPMSDDNVARFIDKYAATARMRCNEVPDNVTPHMFRHSRALHLYRKGVPLVLIAEWLGHSDLETTQIYAYADTEMKRQAIEKAMANNHPLFKQAATETEISEEDTFLKAYALR